MENPSIKTINLKAQTEHMLHNAVLIVEMAMDLKERSTIGEKYVCYLRSLAVRASRAITAMQSSGRSFLLLAQKLITSALKNIESSPNGESALFVVKMEYEKLLVILERELMDIEDYESADIALSNELNNTTISSISEKIKNLETKQRFSDSVFLRSTCSTRSMKHEIDEKYPESWSRESLIDLNNIMNLPPVPEDIFTSFTKPVRTSSLSSLKSLRKVKLYLQRAAYSEDDEESEVEDLIGSDEPSSSDSEVRPSIFQSRKSTILGNIKEET